MRTLSSVTLALLVSLGGSALAGPGGTCHFHGNNPVSKDTVVGCAEKEKMRLIEKGSIAPTWKAVTHTGIEQVDGREGKEWRIVYSDPANADKAKANLYMFFSIPGNFIAANFTGK